MHSCENGNKLLISVFTLIQTFTPNEHADFLIFYLVYSIRSQGSQWQNINKYVGVDSYYGMFVYYFNHYASVNKLKNYYNHNSSGLHENFIY